MSTSLSPWEPGILSLGVYVFMICALVALLLFFCAWLGEKKGTPEKGRPYECGIIPTGTARFRYPIPFYLVGIFFLIFDVDSFDNGLCRGTMPAAGIGEIEYNVGFSRSLLFGHFVLFLVG